MDLAVTFRVENNTFVERLRAVIQEDKITQNILKELSLGGVKEFAEKDKFLLFQGKIYVPIKLRKEVIIKQHNLPIYKY